VAVYSASGCSILLVYRRELVRIQRDDLGHGRRPEQNVVEALLPSHS
jgi:hypothetical protein